MLKLCPSPKPILTTYPGAPAAPGRAPARPRPAARRRAPNPTRARSGREQPSVGRARDAHAVRLVLERARHDLVPRGHDGQDERAAADALHRGRLPVRPRADAGGGALRPGPAAGGAAAARPRRACVPDAAGRAAERGSACARSCSRARRLRMRCAPPRRVPARHRAWARRCHEWPCCHPKPLPPTHCTHACGWPLPHPLRSFSRSAPPMPLAGWPADVRARARIHARAARAGAPVDVRLGHVLPEREPDIPPVRHQGARRVAAQVLGRGRRLLRVAGAPARPPRARATARPCCAAAAVLRA